MLNSQFSNHFEHAARQQSFYYIFHESSSFHLFILFLSFCIHEFLIRQIPVEEIAEPADTLEIFQFVISAFGQRFDVIDRKFVIRNKIATDRTSAFCFVLNGDPVG